METLYGLHPVEEAVRSESRQFDHICFARDRRDQRMQQLIDRCRDAGIRLCFESREHLTRLARTAAHQGVVAVVQEREFLSLDDLLTGCTGSPLLLVLDGIEDPQNFGALLRTADGAGVHGIVIPERRSAPLSPSAVKASAGAAEYSRIARVVNLVRALGELKDLGLWSVGLDERGTRDYDQFDYTGPCVLVLGREGAGLHDLVRRTCDHLLRIPMAGQVPSLNVAAAGAAVLFEAARQRRSASSPAAEVKPMSASMKGLGKRLAKGLGS